MASNPHIHSAIACAAPNCGNIKGANNHWFIAVPISSAGMRGHAICIWHTDTLDIDGALPLCGESCASKMISIWMSSTKEARCAESNV